MAIVTLYLCPLDPPPGDRLSPLALELLRDAANGITVEATAARLNYSPGYLYRLRGCLFDLFGVESIAACVAAAMRHGLIV